jgi:hypothetical protein
MTSQPQSLRLSDLRGAPELLLATYLDTSVWSRYLREPGVRVRAVQPQ